MSFWSDAFFPTNTDLACNQGFICYTPPDMKEITDQVGTSPEDVCLLVKSVRNLSMLLMTAVMFYALFLHTRMPGEQEYASPSVPEETVLFYQPDEIHYLSPVADMPAELEYLNQTRYLA